MTRLNYQCTYYVFYLSEFVGPTILLSLFDFKLQLVFFYLSAFHHLMNILTLRHYRQIEQRYVGLLTEINL